MIFTLGIGAACFAQSAQAEENWEVAFKAKGQFLCEWISVKHLDSNGIPKPPICIDPSPVTADGAYDEVREYFASWKIIDPDFAASVQTQFNDAWDRRWSGIIEGQVPPTLSDALLGHTVTGGAELSDDCRGGGLTEVRSIEQLPQGIVVELRRGDVAGQQYPKLDFIVGGMCADHVLIAVDAYDPRFPVHAISFRSGTSNWEPTSETILTVRPHTLGELKQLIQSDDARTLTSQWAKLKRWRYQKGLIAVEPLRRNGPFRELNLSDDEVREIRGVMLEVMPGAILNISGVVSGCLCQDGTACSAQVWVLAEYPQRPERSKDVELSAINGHWVIGSLQRWYLDSENLESKQFPSRDAYDAARQTLNDEFPVCATQLRRGFVEQH
ncbi:MAG TPA: hypothetical protein VHZ99_03065 [Steroidobacteraceae bacterium]|jgi:hypothetical protein|nr:hypothetical protein [Steroidobacteraceae bacterium]